MSAQAAGGAAPVLPAWPVSREGTRGCCPWGAVLGGDGGHGSCPCVAGFSCFFPAPESPPAAEGLVLTGGQISGPNEVCGDVYLHSGLKME